MTEDKFSESLDFAVIGAQKCATSWMYYCLADHPDVKMPPSKREKVYLGGSMHEEKGDEWYFSSINVGGSTKIKGDVSVDYLFDPSSPSTLANVVPDVKLVALLRDPINRAVSSYFWNLRRRNIGELDLNHGMRRVLRKTREAENLTAYDPSATAINILARGLYDVQVERYLNYFEPTQILLLPYTAVKHRPTEVLKQVYQFIGADPTFYPSQLTQTRRPKRNTYLKSLLALERDLPDTAFFKRVVDYIHQGISYLGVKRKRPRLSRSVWGKMHDFYHDHVETLFSIVNRLPPDNDLWNGVCWLERKMDEREVPLP